MNYGAGGGYGAIGYQGENLTQGSGGNSNNSNGDGFGGEGEDAVVGYDNKIYTRATPGPSINSGSGGGDVALTYNSQYIGEAEKGASGVVVLYFKV